MKNRFIYLCILIILLLSSCQNKTILSDLVSQEEKVKKINSDNEINNKNSERKDQIDIIEEKENKVNVNYKTDNKNIELEEKVDITEKKHNYNFPISFIYKSCNTENLFYRKYRIEKDGSFFVDYNLSDGEIPRKLESFHLKEIIKLIENLNIFTISDEKPFEDNCKGNFKEFTFTLDSNQKTLKSTYDQGNLFSSMNKIESKLEELAILSKSIKNYSYDLPFELVNAQYECQPKQGQFTYAKIFKGNNNKYFLEYFPKNIWGIKGDEYPKEDEELSPKFINMGFIKSTIELSLDQLNSLISDLYKYDLSNLSELKRKPGPNVALTASCIESKKGIRLNVNNSVKTYFSQRDIIIPSLYQIISNLENKIIELIKVVKFEPNVYSKPINFSGSSFGYQNGLEKNTKFNGLNSIIIDETGNLFVAEYLKIRKVSPTGEVSIIAGGNDFGYVDGKGEDARFYVINDIVIDKNGNLFVNDITKIRKIDTSGIVTTITGSKSGYIDGSFKDAKFRSLKGMAIDVEGNIFVIDDFKIRKVDVEGNVSTIAGGNDFGYVDGKGKDARFKFPNDITIDSIGNLYIADTNNNVIRKIDIEGNVTTIAGSYPGYIDAKGVNAKFDHPNGIVIDSIGNLYVTDTNNNVIRKIDINGNVTTITDRNYVYENGKLLNNKSLKSLTIDKQGNIYFFDSINVKIRKIVKK